MTTARSKARMAREAPLRILVIGAHPDDCEVTSGGTACLWARAGHKVCFVSATDGGTGHHLKSGAQLVRRRAREAAAAAKVLGVESRVLDIPGGCILPSLEYRNLFIRLIREFGPDLVLTHRPNDYHPDHRYTSQLVQDSAYVVTVPGNLPQVPALRRNPVMAYLADRFQKPIPFKPDVVVGIDAVLETKIDALHCHVSQMYEWLPWNQGIEQEVPGEDRERRGWMRKQRIVNNRDLAKKYRSQLALRYGSAKGARIKYAEAFEICEYGHKPDATELKRLFPF